MSCNGCRILRKGCTDNCCLRQSIESIDSPQSQANATLFVAKFFGRAKLLSLLSSVAESQRSALFQSLLYEACGRIVNPVSGAVGLMGTENWHVCESAVETVLRGGVLRPSPALDEGSEANKKGLYGSQDLKEIDINDEISGLDLGLTAGVTVGGRVKRRSGKRRPATPSDVSETTSLESGFVCHEDLQSNLNRHEAKLLRLFL